jgi:hypothetical protein
MTVIYADADGEITLLRLVMTRASAVVSSEPSFFASEVALHRLASPEPEAEEPRGPANHSRCDPALAPAQR